jgi:hypothetical protein
MMGLHWHLEIEKEKKMGSQRENCLEIWRENLMDWNLVN